MEPGGPYIIQSLTHARYNVCGFRIFETEDVIGLSAEWSHSLNMLDINISSIYDEVCQTLTPNISENMAAGVDVVVSCDSRMIFIGFLRNLRNRTVYKSVNSISMFSKIEGQKLSDIVLDASVWNDMHDVGQVLLHVDKVSTSCWFHFKDLHDMQDSYSLLGRLIKDASLVLLIFALILALIICLGNPWSPAVAPICQYVLPIFTSQPQNLPYCK